MEMNLPLYANSAFSYATGLLIGTLTGFCFGFVLERAGFGRARNLAAQFYLNDMRVLKVMFTAIVTALLGLTVLSGVGIVDLSLVTIPETFLGPQIVGGLLLGAGFIISGYCPGTAVAASASGNLDGVFSLLGVVAGSLVFGFAYDPLEKFYKSGAMGPVTLPEVLGLPMPVVTVAVVLMAVGAFIGAEKVEEIVNKKAGQTAPESSRRTRTAVFAGLAVVALVGVATLAVPAKKGLPERSIGTIGALDLAREIVTSPDRLYVLDLRQPAAPAKGSVPGSMTVPADDAKALFLTQLNGRRLVIYGEGKALPAFPEGVRKYRGEVVALEGGYEAFKSVVMTSPTLPENPTPVLIAEFKLKNAYYSYFSGAAAAPAPAALPRPVTAPSSSAPKKGGGC
jgi:hypothetical protein